MRSQQRGFGSDNHASVDNDIFEFLLQLNQGHAPAYGSDEISEQARKIISETFGGKPEIFFVFNGTAANVLSMRGLLRSHEAVICTDCAHIALDECGAPEFHGGHKLLTVANQNGKLTIEAIKPLLVRLGDQHAVQAKMLSITQPTELGTVYTIEEMKQLREFCTRHNLFLHVDGSRLANAANFLNVSLSDITSKIGIDALSLGGTKNGLLGAEAVIFWNHDVTHFKYIQKQELQLSSKTRFLAGQFIAYLSNQKWKKIAIKSTGLAQELANRLKEFPKIQVLYPVESNAVFIQFPKEWTKALRETCFFYIWDEQTWSARLMLSHDSQIEDIDRFCQKIKELQ